MPSETKIINIFIAHPADVAKEAKRVKEKCHLLNQGVEGRKILLKAKDYTDLSPSAGNPQETINKELAEACDIFVLILGKSTGNEGFTQEISIGLKRWEESKIPFKFYIKKLQLSPNDKKIRDEFLSPLKDKILYKEFTTLEELGDLLTIDFLRELEISQSTQTAENTNSSVVSSSSLPAIINPTALQNDNKQLSSLTNTNLPAVIGKIHEDLSSGLELSDYQTARLYLFATSNLYDVRLNSEILDNHEINLLYSFKEQFKLNSKERKLIIRTILSDRFHLKTGWYWLKKVKKSVILEFSISLLFSDQSEDVRRGALDIMDNFWEDNFYGLLSFINEDTSDTVKQEAIQILANHPSEKAIPILEKLAKDNSENVKKEAEEKRLYLLSLLNPHQAISNILADKTSGYKISPNLYKAAFDNELRQLLKSSQTNIKVDALEEIINRKLLTNDEYKALLTDSEWSIKYLALKGLLNSNENLTIEFISGTLKDSDGGISRRLLSYSKNYEEKDLIMQVMDKMKQEELLNTIQWGYFGSIAYEIYGKKYWETSKKEIYSSLDDQFKHKHEELLAKMANNNPTSIERLKKLFAEYDEFIQKGFIAAGLKVILEKGSKNDIKYAYKYIDHDDYLIKPLAMSFLEKYGTDKESLFFFEDAVSSNDYRSESKVQIALKLDKSKEHIIMQKCLNLKKREFIVPAIAYALKHTIKLNVKELKKMLYDENDNIRKASLTYLINSLSYGSLRKLLDNYYKEGHYYYNVVSYLDYVLYSPASFKNEFKKKITEELLRKID